MSTTQDIIDMAKAHPDWSIDKLRIELKSSYQRVTAVLDAYDIRKIKGDAKEKEAEVVRLFNAVEGMTNTQLARLVGLSRQNVAVILDKHNLRSSFTTCVYKDPDKWAEILDLLETTNLNRDKIAEKVGINVNTLDRFTRYNGYDAKERAQRIKRVRLNVQRAEEKWPDIKKQLDETDIPMQVIAQELKVTYSEFKQLCDAHDYPTAERKRRLVSSGETKVHATHEKIESMDGKGLSTFAHRLPLNRIAEVFR